jgi:hypothetical protein
MGDVADGSSLIQARAEKVHREHNRNHHLHHQHNKHRREVAGITEVVRTVSVIQQVAVDTNGVTLAVSIFTASSTPSIVEPDTTANPPVPSAQFKDANTSVAAISAVPSVVDTASSAPDATSIPAAVLNVTSSSQSLPAEPATTASAIATTISLASSATPLGLNATGKKYQLLAQIDRLTYLPVSTDLLSSNYKTIPTTRITSLSSNRTRTFTSSGSNTTITKARTFFVTTSATTSTSSTSSTSTDAVIVGIGGVGNAGNVGNGGTTPNTGSGVSGGSSQTESPSPVATPVVVGSVFGGLAGLALILVIILFLLRWKKRQNGVRLSNGDESNQRSQPGLSDGFNGPSSAPLAQRSSTFGIPAAFASLAGYSKRASHAPSHTNSSTAGSEKGFYRVSGRKLPPAIQTGTDGYGDDFNGPLSGSSFYRDSRGFYGGAGMPTSPIVGNSSQLERHDSGTPILRPGPARTPVTTPGGPAATPPQSTPSPGPAFRRPDALGRSHPSRDGSHASKFTEEV